VFTGIVEELGTVDSAEPVGGGVRLAITGPVVATDARPGDSIAVNGVCLTVVEVSGGRFTADVVHETLRRSSLKSLVPGGQVNLERPLAVGDRLGGHIVQGHVDGTGVFRKSDPDGTTHFDIPQRLSRYLVEKGSIAVDGVSLTVVDAGTREFSVALIPTTQELTTLGRLNPGDEVNIEVDVLAKHVERLAEAHTPGTTRSDAVEPR
jgi:riboflavin synthase